MNITVYPQSIDRDTKELVKGEPSLVAGITGTKLVVVGDLPFPLNQYIAVEDLRDISGDEAIKMFYVIAGSKYSGYSSVIYEGVDRESIKKFLSSNFSKDEQMAITTGIDTGKVFGSL